MVPNSKKGHKLSPKNYRPISLLLSFGKHYANHLFTQHIENLYSFGTSVENRVSWMSKGACQ